MISKYSRRSQHPCGFDAIDSSTNLQFLQSLFQASEDHPRGTKFQNYFSSLARFWYFTIFSFCFIFVLWSTGTVKLVRWLIILFLLIFINPSLLVEIKWSVCISESHRIWCDSFLKQILVCAFPICQHVQIKISENNLFHPVVFSLLFFLYQFAT